MIIIADTERKLSMRSIVCYGDSNTWGFMPKAYPPEWSVNRFARDVRWPGVLQKMLGDEWYVIEEGLNGRTTFLDDPQDMNRNGLKFIDTCMLTHMPCDLVIVMLGTNDVKEFLGATPLIISKGVEAIVKRTKAGGYGLKGNAPEILVIAPPALGEGMMDAHPGDEFGATSVAKSRALSAYYEKIATANGVHFLDACAELTADAADCVHMNAEGHRRLAEMVSEAIGKIFAE